MIDSEVSRYQIILGAPPSGHHTSRRLPITRRTSYGDSNELSTPMSSNIENVRYSKSHLDWKTFNGDSEEDYSEVTIGIKTKDSSQNLARECVDFEILTMTLKRRFGWKENLNPSHCSTRLWTEE